MFIVVFFIIFIISLDAVKNKKIVDVRIPKINIRPFESEIKIESKIIQKQFFGKVLNRSPLKGYLTKTSNRILCTK